MYDFWYFWDQTTVFMNNGMASTTQLLFQLNKNAELFYSQVGRKIQCESYRNVNDGPKRLSFVVRTKMNVNYSYAAVSLSKKTLGVILIGIIALQHVSVI